MERINQYGFYELGKALEQLSAYSGDVSPSKAVLSVWKSQAHLRILLSGKPFPIEVSRAAAETLKERLDSIDAEFFTIANEAGEREISIPSADAHPIPSWRWTRIKDALTTFEAVFNAEMSEATAYFVPRRGIYFTPALVDKADESFPQEIAGSVPQKARAEWCAAGRCLAFNLLSASGFHVARAVESTMEVYYQLYTGKTNTLRGWDDYYKALEAVRSSGNAPAPREKTLVEFLQMKDDFRNPIMHPRVSLNESDARMLFLNGESLIIAMAEEIKDLRAAKGTALTVVQAAITGAP